jgi:transcriptional regulator with XRE-family HTH domain
MEPRGRDIDQHVADNLKIIRNSKGISQTALAVEMARRNWRWHQTTVRRVESAAQTLSIGEVTDLAAVLGVTLDQLTTPGEDTPEINAAQKAGEALQASWAVAAKAICSLNLAAARARSALPAAAGSSYPRVQELAEVIAAALELYTVETAAKAGIEAAAAEDAKTGKS